MNCHLLPHSNQKASGDDSKRNFVLPVWFDVYNIWLVTQKSDATLNVPR